MTEISLQEYIERVEDAIEQGRYGEAVAHGRYILEQYPKHVATYQLLGKAMLEANQVEDAEDMFLRVLSADPEDMVAWIGMSEVHSQHGELDAATWYLERAFELAADNEIVEEALRHLYAQRDGVEPQRAQLTHGALARLYLKGDLLSRAISEFRTLVAQHPERVDLLVALGEALWRNEQRLEASEVCQQVLDVLPYCLKANLILGEIWTSSGQEEGEAYLRRAETLDPENRRAQQLFGATSPLVLRQVYIAPLEYGPRTEEGQPAWMADREAAPEEEPLLYEEEAPLADITAALEAQIEIPSWLEEIVGEESGEAPEAPGIPETTGEELREEVTPMPSAEEPEWLSEVGEELVAEGRKEAEAKKEAPEWPGEPGPEAVSLEEVPGEKEIPDWLTELKFEPEGEGEIGSEPEITEEPEEEVEVPDWLQELAPSEAATSEAMIEEIPPSYTEESAEAPSPVEEPIAAIEGAQAEKAPPELGEEEIALEAPQAPEEPAAPAPAEIPDWMRELAPREAPAPEATPEEVPEEAAAPQPEAPAAVTEEVAPPLEQPPPEEEEAALPAWMEGEGVPSGDEALAWLEQLAEGKEEELQAQAQVEAESRLAEIMGRAQPSEAPAAEAPQAPEEPAAPAPAEVPDWLQELAPREAPAPEATPLATEAAPEEAPPPPAEEAFGWTAFGEPEVLPEVVALEEEAPVEEAIAPRTEEIAPPEEEVEVLPVPELPTVEAMPPPEVPLPEEAPPAEEARPEAKLKPPAEEVGAEVLAERAKEEEVAPEALPEEPLADSIAAKRAYLKEHPRDYEAWLTLARALWKTDKRQEALEAYTRMIRSSKLLEDVIPDLEGYLEQQPEISTQRVLGDAYMKDGRLQEALDLYRQALETL
jgi:tetratricopeptide (TPR) repeat protein